MPTIPVSLTKALPALSRSVHELPPRPTQIEISQKVMGIMPTEDAAKVQDQISHKADTKPAHGVLSNSTSTIDQSEAEARRQNRSNAPSPECFTTVKSKTQRPVGPNPLAKLVPHKVSQIKQRNASVKGSTRQPMAEKAANISISSAANEKSPKQKRKSGPGESKNVKGGADHKSKTRRSDCRDDKNWMAFVREMGGVPQLSSSTR